MLRKLTYTMSNLRLDEFCWQNDEKVDYFHFAMTKVAYAARTRPGEYLWCMKFKLIFEHASMYLMQTNKYL